MQVRICSRCSCVYEGNVAGSLANSIADLFSGSPSLPPLEGMDLKGFSLLNPDSMPATANPFHLSLGVSDLPSRIPETGIDPTKFTLFPPPNPSAPPWLSNRTTGLLNLATIPALMLLTSGMRGGSSSPPPPLPARGGLQEAPSSFERLARIHALTGGRRG